MKSAPNEKLASTTGEPTSGRTSGREVSRRHFMLASAAAAAGATLGAWSPGARANVGGRLDLMSWEGYSLQNETARWRGQNGVSVNAAVMSNQDDVTAKLVGSPVRLDVAEYSNGYNAIYKDLKVLKPIDIGKIPNYNKSDILARFYDADMWYWDGQHFAIPWIWGLDTLVYNPKYGKVESHKDLLKPEFKGKLTFVDNPLTTWPQIALVAGYGDKFPNLTKEELKDCFRRMEPYRKQCRVFAGSNGDVISLFASGEIAACFVVWSAVPLETAKQNVTTVGATFKGAGALWADAWFVPMTSQNIDTAHAFINQALSPQVQADACASTVGGCVNRKAIPLLDAKTRALFDYNTIDQLLATTPLKGQPPRTSSQYATYADWLQAWSDFRATV
ncbi:extracellular solute-binding protein [Caballeronia sp. LP006]|uniref:ABC transporter substrate-binding protein n=1 Tax=Caballeronia sp. LP006 TaxID=3038552 RepID=UPI00285E1757|nr:extracellular solute-binding protein [Caballeronia sp. LP006]MDR5832574.1 extracellular solute-binding protein [Caballeronia sp. LP006]